MSADTSWIDNVTPNTPGSKAIQNLNENDKRDIKN